MAVSEHQYQSADASDSNTETHTHRHRQGWQNFDGEQRHMDWVTGSDVHIPVVCVHTKSVECNSDSSPYMQSHQRADKNNFQTDINPQGQVHHCQGDRNQQRNTCDALVSENNNKSELSSVPQCSFLFVAPASALSWTLLSMLSRDALTRGKQFERVAK